MFDKDKFVELLTLAKGNERSLNQFSNACEISPAHISRYMRKILSNPPSPDLLKRIAKVSAGRVTYQELMDTVGYSPESVDKPSSTKMEKLYKVIARAEDLNEENLEIVSEMLEAIIKDRKEKQSKLK
jgi:transcriptional regulator with XRE-family HTH domain